MATPPRSEPSTDDPRASTPSSWAVTYARQEVSVFEPAPPGKVRIELLTDPWSVWCWGFEPVRRTLEHRYPSFEFSNFLGGMFEEVPDHRAIGFDVARFFRSVHESTGMPISVGAVMRDRPTSTYPACVAAHAVRLLRPEAEARYVRALREAAYLDELNISRPDVARDVAARVGIDAREFEVALGSGEPEREFRLRLEVLERLGLHAYPTLLVTAGDRTARIDGYQNLSTIITIAESLSGRVHVARPAPAIDAVLAEGERLATREVSTVLGISVEDAYDRLLEMHRAGRVERERHPTGDVWTRERARANASAREG